MAEPYDETRAPQGRTVATEGSTYAAPFDDTGGWRPTADVWRRLLPGHELTETKPFFVTTEFAAMLAALAGLAVTAASSDSLDAGLVWPLATVIVAAYVVSRGLAKAAAPSFSWDPRATSRATDGGTEARAGGEARTEQTDRVASAARHEEETRQMSTMAREQYGTPPGGPMAPMYGYGRGFGVRQAFPIETKPFFLTSEFWGSVALIIGLAIAAGTSDQVDARLFWQLATAITVGYVVSRGIAKSGTKSRAWDPREDLLQGARERVSRHGDSG